MTSDHILKNNVHSTMERVKSKEGTVKDKVRDQERGWEGKRAESRIQ